MKYFLLRSPTQAVCVPSVIINNASSTHGVYHREHESGHCEFFQNGRSQAVWLPAAYRFKGDRLRVSRRGRAVILEPIISDPKTWFDEMDALATPDYFSAGRSQPATPTRELFD